MAGPGRSAASGSVLDFPATKDKGSRDRIGGAVVDPAGIVRVTDVNNNRAGHAGGALLPHALPALPSGSTA
ncbi:hypothetical protein AB5I41_04975 [Sphingomonas sp. MMS24-JH45]